MKKIYTLAFALFLSITIWAQTPQKMSYQAVIRNSSNALITSSPIGMQISILQGSATGSAVYTETLTTNTNANGLVSIEIGNGTVITGTFSTINWANGPYFIKTETDPTGGTAYTISGTSELLSVPYALHAKTAESISGSITETDPIFGTSVASTITTTDINNWNNKLSSETDPVFSASPANGISSSDINNWNNKLSSEVDGSVTNELQSLSISNDTVYLSNGGYAKLPTGFNGDYNSLINKPTAVSSFSNDAGYLTSFTEVDGSLTNELQTLSISNDTVYLSNGGFAKLPAGFNGDYNSLINKPTAVSSFSNDAGYLTSFTELDGSTTNELQTLRISNDTIYLSNGGFAKLPVTNAWSLNGNSGTNAANNFIGTTDNVPLNFKVNNQMAGKIDNTLSNTALGYHSFTTTTPDAHNSSFGAYSLENSNGAYNTAIGSYAFRYHNIGNYNTIIGSQAGQSNTSGSRNVFIGYAAGYSEMGSNKLYIANNFTNPPLIYGDFATAKIGLGTTTPSFKLEVTEDVSFNGVRVGRGNGNIATNTSVGFNALNSNTSGTWNTALGEQALNANTSGYSNTGIGRYALKAITTGNNNTALGSSAMYTISNGSNNTAIGNGSMLNQTSGNDNTSIGTSGFYNKTSGNANTSIGMEAGFNNASGSGNVFLGYRAGYSETGSNKLYIANSSTTTPLIYGDFTSGRVGIGTTTPSFKLEVTDDALFNGVRVGAGNGANFQNAVLGYQALQSNTSGHFNTAIGYQVMYPNTTGDYNTAVGTAALGGNTTGGQNCAFGYASLVTRVSSIDNSAYGTNSLRFGSTGDRNSAFGSSALLNNSGNNNTAIGFQTGNNNYNGSGNVFLGYQAGYNESGSNKLYIANSNTTTPLIYGDFTNGNIGIGTTTIGERLVVQGNHTDGRIATFQNAYDEKYITMGQVLTDDGGYIKYKKSSNYTGIGVHGHTELLIVNGAGNVGIGTLTPSAKLEVDGAIKVTGGIASQFLKADGSLDNNTYLTAIVEVADEFSATTAQTSFTLTQTPSANSKVKMYINGVRISNTAYSVSGTTLTYVPANNGSYSLSASDRIQFDYSY